MEAKIAASGADERSPQEQIRGISRLVPELVRRQEHVLAQILGLLRREGIQLVGVEQLDGQGREYTRRYFQEVIYPVITPMIVGPKHPFPMLRNATLCLVVDLSDRRRRTARISIRDAQHKPRTAFVAVPKVLRRFLRVEAKDGALQLIPLESMLVSHVGQFFPGYDVNAVNAIRITRDADIALDEEATEDMRRAMAKQLLGRRRGAAVRLEHGQGIDRSMREMLRTELDLEAHQLYPCSGLMQTSDLIQIYGSVDRLDLKDPPLQPLPTQRTRPRSIFDWIREGPKLVYHPYHSFAPVAELVAEAAEDDSVLAIKQTLYRTSGDSPIVRALTRAAELGKQVTVVVELRARFDEERNIEWARRLEQGGAHVVYGLVGYKTHCKALLVVRRERDGIRRYVHLGTGNYHDATARLYTDMGIFTCDDLFGQDVSALFNVITGATEPPVWRKVETAPTGLRRTLLHLIRREIDKSAPRSPGRIVAKMNSLVDARIIEALYTASRAGVKVDLIVRGICCLRPGIPGLSENITVRSIVGRFLEHSRVLWLRNGGQEEVYLSSADWMPRNLDRRIELMFPVDDSMHRDYIRTILEKHLQDNVKARILSRDGTYTRSADRRSRVDSQVAIYEFTTKLVGSSSNIVPRRFVPLARRGLSGG